MKLRNGKQLLSGPDCVPVCVEFSSNAIRTYLDDNNVDFQWRRHNTDGDCVFKISLSWSDSIQVGVFDHDGRFTKFEIWLGYKMLYESVINSNVDECLEKCLNELQTILYSMATLFA